MPAAPARLMCAVAGVVDLAEDDNRAELEKRLRLADAMEALDHMQHRLVRRVIVLPWFRFEWFPRARA